VKKFKYFEIQTSSGLDAPIEGVLGMCLNEKFLLPNRPKFYKRSPTLINALKEAGKIPANEFAFYFQSTEKGISHIDIGPPQVDSIKGGDIKNMVKIPVN